MMPLVSPDIEITDTIRDTAHQLAYTVTGCGTTLWRGYSPNAGGFGSLDYYLNEGAIIAKSSTFGFEQPSKASFVLANEAYFLIKKNNGCIDHVNPTEDGGILIEFYHRETYQFLNIYNDGYIIYARNDDPISIEILSQNLYRDLNTKLNE
ncbi:hypothetical protein LZG74_17005 [Dyadobacter sp. CY327]|uniref:hypothetical protein n=1 Tax=Dyadobacter sp. CY327 TaxID=2907301 RepID=UPI001F3B426F|nr:hypothetical protein [Dyadobacter sp. CY327]MCE7072018.1 hypothetical protein [Dyadobacter sp. CY327]